MSGNVKEPEKKRQRFAELENEDLDNLLNAVQAQSTNIVINFVHWSSTLELVIHLCERDTSLSCIKI